MQRLVILIYDKVVVLVLVRRGRRSTTGWGTVIGMVGHGDGESEVGVVSVLYKMGIRSATENRWKTEELQRRRREESEKVFAGAGADPAESTFAWGSLSDSI